MSNRTVEAVLRLSSKLGSMAAFGKLGSEMAKVDKQAKAVGRTQVAVAKATGAAWATAARFLAPAAIAATGAASAKEFASIERRMERIGITADASAAETQAAFETIHQIAADLRVPVNDVVEGLESLVASGREMGEALSVLPAIAGTAHASAAGFGEMATTADALGSSLNIVAADMTKAFDIIAKGGKAGKFELKDMAAHLPSLAPAFARLGYEGLPGLQKLTAALQTVRNETGSSGQAATAFGDVVNKMFSQTVFNNFKRFGVNIREEMAKAKDAGEDTLDAFIRLSKEAIDGDMSKLPQLFTDKEMLIGMGALMSRTEQMSGYMKDLGNAAGTVRADLQRLADDAQGSFDKMGNSWSKLKATIGKGLFDAGLGSGMDAVTNSVEYASAINRGLEKRGVNGFLARSAWGVTHSSEDKMRVARSEGYAPTASDRVARDYAPKAYEVLGRAPMRPRSTGTARALAAAPPPRYAHGATHRDAERSSMQALRANPNDIADAIDEALSLGGRKAETSLADGGEKARAAMQAGADATSEAAAAMKDAARELRGAAGAIRSGAVAGRVSGDVGRSGGSPGEL